MTDPAVTIDTIRAEDIRAKDIVRTRPDDPKAKRRPWFHVEYVMLMFEHGGTADLAYGDAIALWADSDAAEAYIERLTDAANDPAEVDRLLKQLSAPGGVVPGVMVTSSYRLFEVQRDHNLADLTERLDEANARLDVLEAKMVLVRDEVRNVGGQLTDWQGL